MNRNIQGIVYNFDELMPTYIVLDNEIHSAKIVGIDCKNMEDVNELYLYVRTSTKGTVKIHVDDMNRTPEKALARKKAMEKKAGKEGAV